MITARGAQPEPLTAEPEAVDLPLKYPKVVAKDRELSLAFAGGTTLRRGDNEFDEL